MATGTGNLPNQNMDFVPLAELPASDLDKLVENIESLADGSGIGDASVKSDKIDFTTLVKGLVFDIAASDDAMTATSFTQPAHALTAAITLSEASTVRIMARVHLQINTSTTQVMHAQIFNSTTSELIGCEGRTDYGAIQYLGLDSFAFALVSLPAGTTNITYKVYSSSNAGYTCVNTRSTIEYGVV